MNEKTFPKDQRKSGDRFAGPAPPLTAGHLPPDGSGEYTAERVWLMLGVTASAVRALCKRHAVPVRVICGSLYVSPEAIRAAVPAKPWHGRVTRRKGDSR